MTSKGLRPAHFRRWWLPGIAVLGDGGRGRHSGRQFRGNTIEGRPQAALVPGLPQQTLLASSTRQQPVPGWTTTVSQLGLPPGTVVRPTDLRVAAAQDKPRLEQVGDYVVAEVASEGIYGVGSRGDMTWFVTGDGLLSSQFATWDRDVAPSTLAVQGSGRVADVVFPSSRAKS